MMAAEKSLLADLCMKYAPVVDSVRTDTVSHTLKEEGWTQLVQEFNAQTTSLVHRLPTQLKHVSSTLLVFYVFTNNATAA